MKNTKRFINYLFNFAVRGIFIGLMISIFCSYASNSPVYVPSSPTFTTKFSNLLNAFSVSIILWAVTGIFFGFGSFIFTINQWSLLKKTVINFFTYYFGFVFLALLAGWVSLNLINLTKFTVIFIIIYLICWYYNYHKIAKEIASINHKIKTK